MITGTRNQKIASENNNTPFPPGAHTSIFSSGNAASASVKSDVTSSNLETSAFTAAALPPASWIDFTT